MPMIMLKRRAGNPASTARRQKPSTSSSSDTPRRPWSTIQRWSPGRGSGRAGCAGVSAAGLALSAAGGARSEPVDEGMVEDMIGHATPSRNGRRNEERRLARPVQPRLPEGGPMHYIDAIVIPVPRATLDTYKRMSAEWGNAHI